MNSKVVIDVWVADLTFPGYMDRLRRLAEEFDAAHPEYHVNIRGCDFRTLPLEISQAAAQGRPPAVAECYFYITQAARDILKNDGTPLFTSVEKAIGGRKEILGEPVVIDDIIPAVRDYYTYDGDLTSMPSVATTMLLYANADLLRAAGVSEMPRDWDEVEAACGRIAELPDGPSHGITWSNHGLFFQQAIAVQGGLLADHDNGRSGRATSVDLASKEMLAWATWWQRLHQDGHYLYTGKIPDWEGTFKAFATQEVAFRITSSNDLNYMVQAAESGGFGIEVSRFPDNGRAPYGGNALAGTSLWLADGLDEVTRDGALAFLQYMHNPHNAADQHKANSFIPVTNASFALLEEEGWFDKHPYHRVASDQLKTYPAHRATGGLDAATPPPSWGALFGDFAGVQDVMTRAMGDVLTHGADPVARFTEATAEAQKLLDDYRADCLQAGPRSPDTLRVEFFRDAEPYSGADLENVVQLNR
ncbi:extracellular solute-binding protein [Streptosporangium sp. NPDC000396]|uniref:extracellular solute-binding protein n=1 Tax=Streptosporangium sp. NPDC000396 TaxID=3366185 RepID=UPI0036AE0C13